MKRRWGSFDILLDTDKFRLKKIKVDGDLSLQEHKKRDEIWMIYIPAGCKHKIRGYGEFTEISIGAVSYTHLTLPTN